MLKDGFIMMEEDHCVYIKRSNNHFIILSLYVDDILIAGNYKKLIDVTKKWLSSNFEMKDMGEASYVLGVKILCHTPIPGPTRLADPNRVRGARTYTGTLYLLNSTLVYPSLIIC